MVNKDVVIKGTMLILATYTLTMLLVMQVFPQAQTNIAIPSSGSIQTTEGIGAYSDSQCTIPQTAIAWGTLVKGGDSSIILYVKNEGDSPVTLSLDASGWVPTSAANYLTLSWNYDNQPINPNAIVEITLTLSVDANSQGITNFDVNILISGNV